MQIYCSSIEGNWVGVRASGTDEARPFARVADATPAWLTFPVAGVPAAPRYDIRVEHRGWLLNYADQKTDVWPGYDKELGAFHLRYGGVNPLGVATLAVLLLGPAAGVLLLRRRSRHLGKRLDQTLREKAVVAASKAVDGPLPPLLGRTLRTRRGDDFEILRLLGRGSMGAVFEAVARGPERTPGEPWAVKVPFRDTVQNPEMRHRFGREVELCTRLVHPGLVHVLDWGTFDAGPEEGERSWPFLVMELMEGRTLRDELTAVGGEGLPPALVARWICETASALQRVHGAGIIHRDVKPENIFVTPSGHVKVGDFGLAGRVDRHTMTTSDDSLGTPLYMSPEHLEASHTTSASDVFSLGVVAYELLAGRPPYQAENPFALFTKMLTEAPVPLVEARPSLPAALVEVVMRMMARSPAERPTCEEVARDLEPLPGANGSSVP